MSLDRQALQSSSHTAPAHPVKPNLSTAESMSKYSFGAAAFKFQPAADCAPPTQHLPEDWLLNFCQHMHPAAWPWLVKAGGGRAGQELALMAAARAEVSLMVPVAEERVAAAKRDLLLRGGGPTDVTVVAYAHFQAEQAFTVSQLLDGAPHGVSGFQLHCHREASKNTELLKQAAAAYPDLRKLVLVDGAALIPPGLTSLTHLGLRNTPPWHNSDTVKATYDTAAPYVSQLTALELLSSFRAPWPLFQEPKYTPKNLQYLDTSDDLTDSYLATLLQSAPQLKRLGFANYKLISGAPGSAWAVEQLGCHRGSVTAAALLLLPHVASPKGLDIILSEPCLTNRVPQALSIEVSAPQGLPASVTQYLSTLTFQCERINITIAPVVDYHTALRTTLEQVATHIFAPGAVVYVCDPLPDTHAVQIVADALPSLTARLFKVAVSKLPNMVLTDKLLHLVHQLQDISTCISLKRLDIKSNEYASKTWPFKCYTVAKLDLAQVPKLPSHKLNTKVHFRDLILSSVTEADVPAVSAWLSTVDLAFKGQCVKIELPWSDATPHHVALVPYMYFGSPVPESRAGSVIELTRWPLDCDKAVALLRALPHWWCDLRLTDCTWPTDRDGIVAIGAALPPTIASCSIDDGPSDVEALCEGINRRRDEYVRLERKQSIMPMQLAVAGYEEPEEQSYTHVTVCEWDE